MTQTQTHVQMLTLVWMDLKYNIDEPDWAGLVQQPSTRDETSCWHGNNTRTRDVTALIFWTSNVSRLSAFFYSLTTFESHFVYYMTGQFHSSMINQWEFWMKDLHTVFPSHSSVVLLIFDQGSPHCLTTPLIICTISAPSTSLGIKDPQS